MSSHSELRAARRAGLCGACAVGARAVGGRAPSAGALTPTERQIAELVASGRSNKEVAAALFLTPKTVETQLSRIYAKLGIHSRMQLAVRLTREDDATKL